MKHAVVRPPSSTFRHCISTHPEHHSLDLALALQQHDEYRQTLEDLGLNIIRLPPDERHPDSCFVEDTVVVHEEKAFITRLAEESRRGEELAVAEVLKDFLDLSYARKSATIEGGDIIHLPDRLISGLTQRTNAKGVRQMVRWLGVESDIIENSSIIHLKSHVTYLDRNTVIVTKGFRDHPDLQDFEKLVVPKDENYAANTLTVRGVVLMSKKHTMSQDLVRDAGFEVMPLDMSEFEKCEGALTCLSVIF
ncbi:MAG: dimethylarginine dimethylaminohydrolase family protein [Candidatus Thorarchaeota archaeon]